MTFQTSDECQNFCPHAVHASGVPWFGNEHRLQRQLEGARGGRIPKEPSELSVSASPDSSSESSAWAACAVERGFRDGIHKNLCVGCFAFLFTNSKAAESAFVISTSGSLI